MTRRKGHSQTAKAARRPAKKARTRSSFGPFHIPLEMVSRVKKNQTTDSQRVIYPVKIGVFPAGGVLVGNIASTEPFFA